MFLQLLHQRAVEVGEIFENAVLRRCISEWVGGINDCFARKIFGPGRFQGFCGNRPLDRQNHDLSEFGSVGKTSDFRFWIGCGKSLSFPVSRVPRVTS